MFSNSLKYCVIALTYLAEHSDKENKCGVKKIASETKIPLSYLAKLLNKMTNEKIITSVKGPKGGFYLTDENRKIKIYDVLILMDGEDKYGNCMMGFEECNLQSPCPLHTVYTKMKLISVGELSKGVK